MCRTPAAEAAETLQCSEGCWLSLSPTLVVEKTGLIEEQAILSLKLSSSFAVCLFCAFSACFMHVFSLLELLTVAVQSMFLDSVSFELKVGT